MSDVNDAGTGAMAAGSGMDRKSTGFTRSTAGNPTQRTGRADFTQIDPGNDRDGDGATTYRNGTSTNPTAKTGRPDIDNTAPNRSYERLKGAAAHEITDVSAGRIIRSSGGK